MEKNIRQEWIFQSLKIIDYFLSFIKKKNWFFFFQNILSLSIIKHTCKEIMIISLSMMSWKPEEKYTRCSFDGTETKLLVYGSKPRIYEEFPWIHKEIKLEFTRRKFDKMSVFIDNSLICLLTTTKHINTEINV